MDTSRVHPGPDVETIPFGELRIAFDARVLRPRDWTVTQSLWAAELLEEAPPGDVLELCSGAGHIGLLSVWANDRRLVAVDLSPAATAFTTDNAAAAGLGDRVEVRQGRMDEVLRSGETFPLVIADPPWVRRAEIGRFPEDPTLAIDGGDDGLDVARTCLEVIEEHLAPGGTALLQLGSTDQVVRLDAWLEPRRTLRVTEIRRVRDRGVLVRLDWYDGPD
jgi:methylase of polypeptide subunit release factors